MIKRVLIKVSGEALGSDYSVMVDLAKQLAVVRKRGVEICLVLGGGNFLRGRSASGINRATADYMGMMATIMNALAMQDVLQAHGIASRVFSALSMNSVCETYARPRALEALRAGEIVLFAGGTGNPFVSTDTAAVIRSIEMECDAMLKGTDVDGVYSSDPDEDVNAVRYDHLSYKEAIERHLGVLDMSALAIASERGLKTIVFSIKSSDAIADVISGKGKFTEVQ